MDHTFSIEMSSKQHVTNISISDEAHNRVLFEGNLGEPVHLSVEDNTLEFVGENGILRFTLTVEQLRKILTGERRKSSLSAEEGRSKDTQTA